VRGHTAEGSQALVLVIEDHRDMAVFWQRRLRCVSCGAGGDGQDGLEKALIVTRSHPL